MTIQRRRALLAASTATAATLLSGCSFAKHPGPKGDWDRLEDGDLLLAVPKGWDRSVAQSSIWGTKWTDPSDKSAVLMTAQSIKAKDGYDALDLAMNAARAVTRGYQPVGSRTAVTNGSIILAQSFVPGAAAVLKQLTKLNSVCMPLRYLWVFVAYIALRKAGDKFPREYYFVKNNAVALGFGVWCFALTAICCLMGMHSDDPFTMALNIITPVVLSVLGIIMPILAKNEKA